MSAGIPFRIEVNCDDASALFRSNQPPVELKTGSLVVDGAGLSAGAAYQRIPRPAHHWRAWKSAGLHRRLEAGAVECARYASGAQRASLVLDKPTVDRVKSSDRQSLLRARHIELHGRIAEGSAASKPVIEIVLQLDQASASTLHPAAEQPIDANIIAVLRGLNDFSPKPWPARFREIQAAGGRIDITQARVQQGEILAVGGGSLSLNGNGRLEGQLRVTMAGLDQFLAEIGAQQRVQTSPNMDKLVGALDRLAPGLGDVARQQAGANISLGINLLGEQTTLEGKRAVTLPLRFNDGSVFLGPIPIGNTPALF